MTKSLCRAGDRADPSHEADEQKGNGLQKPGGAGPAGLRATAMERGNFPRTRCWEMGLKNWMVDGDEWGNWGIDELGISRSWDRLQTSQASQVDSCWVNPWWRVQHTFICYHFDGYMYNMYYVCVCVCVYVFMSLWLYAYMYICIYIYYMSILYVYIYTCLYVYMSIYVYIYDRGTFRYYFVALLSSDFLSFDLIKLIKLINFFRLIKLVKLFKF